MISRKRKKYVVMQEVVEKIISNSFKNTEEFDGYALPFPESAVKGY